MDNQTGIRIAEARHAAGFTQKALADHLGVPLWTVSQLELGKGDLPGLLPAIAGATERPREWFAPSDGAPQSVYASVGERTDANALAATGKFLVLSAITLLVTIRFFTEVVPVLPRAANFIDIPIFIALAAATVLLPPRPRDSRTSSRAYIAVGAPAAAFLVLSVASVLFNSGRVHPAPVLVFIYGFLAPFVVFSASYRLWPPGNAKSLSRLLVALGVLQLAVVALIDLPKFLASRNPDVISGTFGTNPYQLVLFLLLFATLLAGILTFEPRRQTARFAPPLIAAVFAAILLAQYRALLATMFVALVFVGVLIGGRARGVVVALLAMVTFVSVFSYVASNVPGLRLGKTVAILTQNPLSFVEERFSTSQTVTGLYADIPSAVAVGTGPGTFSSRAWQTFANAGSTSGSNVAGSYAPRLTGGLYQTDVSEKYVRPVLEGGAVVQGSRALSQPHSSYLALAAEVGLFGLVLIGGIYFAALARSIRVARKAMARSDGVSAVPALALATAVGFLTLVQMGFLENWFEVTRATFVLWAMFAVVAKETDAENVHI